MQPTVLLFPGQGAQKVGMGADFAERFPVAAELFERANDALGYDLRKLCFEGPEDELTLTKYAQPAIYLTSAAIVRVLEDQGLVRREDVVATAGLSLGEYTALWFAGVLDFESGLKLVSQRGAFMQEASNAPPSGMVSLIGADRELAERVAEKAAEGEVLSVANILSPGQIVLSGAKSAVERAVVVAKDEGIRRAIVLKVAGAFHSALMQSAADRLREELTNTEIQTPQIPVAGNVSGQFMTDADEIRRCLEAQVVSPVLWTDAMGTLLSKGARHFVEPGPGKVLCGLLKKIDRDTTSQSFDCVADLAVEAES